MPPKPRPTRAETVRKHRKLLKSLTTPASKPDPLLLSVARSNATITATLRRIKIATRELGDQTFEAAKTAHRFGAVMGSIQQCIEDVTGSRPGQFDPCILEKDPVKKKDQAENVAVEIRSEFAGEWRNPIRNVTGKEVGKSTVGQLTVVVMSRLN